MEIRIIIDEAITRSVSPEGSGETDIQAGEEALAIRCRVAERALVKAKQHYAGLLKLHETTQQHYRQLQDEHAALTTKYDQLANNPQGTEAELSKKLKTAYAKNGSLAKQLADRERYTGECQEKIAHLQAVVQQQGERFQDMEAERDRVRDAYYQTLRELRALKETTQLESAP